MYFKIKLRGARTTKTNRDQPQSIFVDTLQTLGWFDSLSALADDAQSIDLPTDDVLTQLLQEMDVPPSDISPILALRPDRHNQPRMWQVFQQATQSLIASLGSLQKPPVFPILRDVNDPDYRYFYIHVFAAATPALKQYHQRLGVDPAITRATLADIGRHMRVHEKRHGGSGLAGPYWLMLHFRGMLYQLGRLQFELQAMPGWLQNALIATHQPYDASSPILSLHIPDFSGPMTPDACDESITQAADFFSRIIPDKKITRATCESWLLDPQLADYLPHQSNIILFQRRFNLGSALIEDSFKALRFVFGAVPENIDQLPRLTSLQRAMIDHLRTGRRWYIRQGWFTMPTRTASPPRSTSSALKQVSLSA